MKSEYLDTIITEDRKIVAESTNKLTWLYYIINKTILGHIKWGIEKKNVITIPTIIQAYWVIQRKHEIKSNWNEILGKTLCSVLENYFTYYLTKKNWQYFTPNDTGYFVKEWHCQNYLFRLI